MKSKRSSKILQDKQLRVLALALLDAYATSAEARKVPSWPFSLSAGVIIPITDQMKVTRSNFVSRAATLLQSKAAHEKSLARLATEHAHKFVAQKTSKDDAATGLIEAVAEQGIVSFRYLAQNRIFRFKDSVEEIKIGRVRAVLTEYFSSEWAMLAKNKKVKFVSAERFSIQHEDDFTIKMWPVVWVVEVDAAHENVPEEGKWLIDVAISLLRLSYQAWDGWFPGLGKIEPHPLEPFRAEDEDAILADGLVSCGGQHTAPWYEINFLVERCSQTDKFMSIATLIFDPPKRSLAERCSQALGWLTRGRQARDRAERLLYFFTAIESLLSTDDKSAPVVQNIARHAAVVLSNDNSLRGLIAKDIRSLYERRSALVHSGNRSVLWGDANAAQQLAELLLQTVLAKSNLSIKHDAFTAELSAASYGTLWPAPVA